MTNIELRLADTVEEIMEAQSLQELVKLFDNAMEDELLAEHREELTKRFQEQSLRFTAPEKEVVEVPETVNDVEIRVVEPAAVSEDPAAALLKSLLEELAALKAQIAKPAAPAPTIHGVAAGRKYTIGKQDLSWTTTPQIHAIMRILVGTGRKEFTDQQVAELMMNNRHMLNTRQDPFRIFRYYRKQLVDHGNLNQIG